MQIIEEVPNITAAAAIAAEAFGRENDKEYAHGVEAILSKGKPYSALSDAKELIGFACFFTISDVLYLSAIAVSPRYNRSGIGQLLIKRGINDHNLPFIGWRTQSLPAFLAFQKVCVAVAPSPQRADISCEERSVMIARHEGHESAIARGAYGKALFGEKPIADNPELQLWWDRQCVYEDGDAIYSVGRILEEG